MGTANRLRQYLIQKRINNREADDLFGFSNGLTGKFLAGKTNLGVDKIASILSAFPDLNGDWLLTGRGSMTVFNVEEDVMPTARVNKRLDSTLSKQLSECEDRVRDKDQTIAALQETIKAYKTLLKNRTFST